MKKLHNITKKGTGTTQDLFDHIVERMNDNLQEIADEVGGLSLSEANPYFDVKILTYEVEGSNGAMLAIVKGIPVATGDEVIIGKQIQFLAAPEEGYLVKEWKVDGTPVADHVDDSLVLTMPDADVEVKVEFIEAHEVTFEVEDGQGQITATVDGEPINSGDLVRHEKEVIFAGSPDENYWIEDWIKDGASQSDDSDTFTIASLEADAEVKVEFKEGHVVTFGIEDGDGEITAATGGDDIDSGDYVKHGSEVVFTAAAGDGQEVKDWHKDGVAQTDTSETFTIASVEDDVEVNVEFGPE